MALLRSVATVASYTAISRVFGFVRDVLTAAILGAGPVADAFFVAQRLPNLFRSLFAEGAFSAAFVPLFAGTMAEHGREPARIFAEDALAVLLTALLGFVLLGEIFMPTVMDVIAPGFRQQADKFELAVDLARITFPYLLFIALVALQGGVLNSVERFAAAAATPILLNLFLIAALLMMRQFGWRDGRALAWAVSAAGFAQFLWLLLACAHAGLVLRLPLPRLTQGVRRTLAVMAPGTIGAGVTQLNLLISTALASLLPSGSVSYLYYADRLNQLPLGVVGIAVGTAILPSLSREVRLGHLPDAVATQNRGIELALLLTLPAAIALGVLATPILSVLFERGAFGPTDTMATAAALTAYAAGLPAFVLIKVLAPAFFARHDTATPVKVAVAAMAVNLCLDRPRDDDGRLAECVGAARAADSARALRVRRARAAQPAADRRRGARHGCSPGGVADRTGADARGPHHVASGRACHAGWRRVRRLRCIGARSRDRRLARSLGAPTPATGLTGASLQR